MWNERVKEGETVMQVVLANCSRFWKASAKKNVTKGGRDKKACRLPENAFFYSFLLLLSFVLFFFFFFVSFLLSENVTLSSFQLASLAVFSSVPLITVISSRILTPVFISFLFFFFFFLPRWAAMAARFDNIFRLYLFLFSYFPFTLFKFLPCVSSYSHLFNILLIVYDICTSRYFRYFLFFYVHSFLHSLILFLFLWNCCYWLMLLDRGTVC